METFVGIACRHSRHREFGPILFKTVLEYLALEKPDCIVVEEKLKDSKQLLGASGKDLADLIGQEKARIEIDSADETNPTILWEGSVKLKPDYPSFEIRAAFSYAIKHKVPIFMVDEPFSMYNATFSLELRKRGIIGFFFDDPLRYKIHLTNFDEPPSNQDLRLKQRNLFMKGAIGLIDRIYKPKVLASVGGEWHYHLFDLDGILMEPDYGQEFLLQEIVTAREKRIHFATVWKIHEKTG